ncbi:hypothetical protein CEXT_514071 [Caerostris extrusa]|uniref:Uncharacterized protein n=1 Tax=Caerostris extrusa TaxID=172846 RepID=A0AAV4N793_CAEEX|nr:hypothetical protein CEXT_514071 [Caerostris extrusa]
MLLILLVQLKHHLYTILYRNLVKRKIRTSHDRFSLGSATTKHVYSHEYNIKSRTSESSNSIPVCSVISHNSNNNNNGLTDPRLNRKNAPAKTPSLVISLNKKKEII